MNTCAIGEETFGEEEVREWMTDGNIRPMNEDSIEDRR
jgi:hypothetical protein